MLTALTSPHAPTRTAAEQQYQTLLQSDPTSLARELCAATTPQASASPSAAGSSAGVSLALVLLRQLVRGPHFARVQAGARQEMCEFLMDVVDKHPSEQVKFKAAEVLVVMPAEHLNEEVLSRCISFIRRKDDVVVRAGLYILDGLAEFAFDDVVAQRGTKLADTVLMRMDATSPVQTRLAALRAACSLVVGAPATAGDGNGASTELDPALRALGEHLPLTTMEAVAAVLSSPGGGGGGTAECEKTMQSLALVCETRPQVLDRDLGRFCALLLEACEAPALPTGIKSLCLTNLASVLARRGVSAVSDEEFCTRAIRTLLLCTVSDPDFVSQHDAFSIPSEEDPLELQVGGIRGAALDALQQFAGSVSVDQNASKLLLGRVFAMVKVLLSSENWVERHAGLSAMGAMAPGMEKRMWAHLQDMVSGSARLQETDPEPRVRAAASGCLATLLKQCPALGQGIRKSMHGTVIPSLVRALAGNEARDTTYSRCAVLVGVSSFLEGPAPREVVAPYVDGMAATLVNCLKSSQTPVQVKVLEALALLATAVGPDFARFYNDLIPSIKQVLAFLNAESELAKAAMTCVAAVAECAGKERFARDATELLGAILGRAQTKAAAAAAATSTAKDETLELEGLFEFVHRVCAVLGPDFAPFMGHVLPLALQAAQADLGVHISEADPTSAGAAGTAGANNGEEEDDDDATESGHMSTTIRSRGVGALNVTANVYAFQVRAAAIKAIDSMADALGDRFSPADLDKCCQVVLENVENRLATAQINAKAAEAVGSLFHAACKLAQKNPAEYAPAARTLFVRVATVLLSRLAQDVTVSEEATERRQALVEAFERCTRACYFSGDMRDRGGELGPAIVTPPSELLPKVVDAVLEVYKASLTRRRDGEKDVRSRGFEIARVREFHELLEGDEEDLCKELVDSLGYMFKADPVGMWPSFDSQVLPFFATVLQQQRCAPPTGKHKGLEHNALCVFVDAMEFCPPAARERALAMKLDEVVLASYLSSGAPGLMQVAAYGLGVYAKVGVLAPAHVAGVVLALMNALKMCLQQQLHQREEDDDATADWTSAKENVASALAKVSSVASAPEVREQALRAWLETLPLTVDEMEAQFSHEMLCHLVLQKDPVLVAPQVRAHVVKVLATCCLPVPAASQNGAEEDVVDVAGAQVRMVLAPEALKTLRQTCDAAEWTAIVSALPGLDEGAKRTLLLVG